MKGVDDDLSIAAALVLYILEGSPILGLYGDPPVWLVIFLDSAIMLVHKKAWGMTLNTGTELPSSNTSNVWSGIFWACRFISRGWLLTGGAAQLRKPNMPRRELSLQNTISE